MTAMDIAVVGGGNGAYTMAGDFALAGHRVRMCPGPRQRHAALFEQGRVTLSGLGRTGVAKLAAVSEDPAAVVTGAAVVCCPDPAPSQPRRAAALAGCLEDGQLVLLSPGSLGPLVFERVLRQAGRSPQVTYAEPGTLPYLTRKTGPAAVQVSGLARHLPVGVFPARRTEAALAAVVRLYPAAHAVENALSAALLNVGPVIHSVLFLLNTGAIEHFEAWDIHNEGTTASVKKLVLAHDAERIALRRALGFTSHHYPFRDHYEPDGDNEWMYGRKAHTDLVVSQKWRERLDFGHRYIEEDVKCNLALMASVGRAAGVATPIADALLTLYGAIRGEDLRQTGRTLDALGVGGLTPAELAEVLQNGLGRRAAGHG